MVEMCKRLLSSIVLLICVGVGYMYGQSGTLPIIYINTENNADITSKYDYLNAKLRITELKDFKESTYDIQIRGRGNYTWWGDTFLKKPYKIKFSEKTVILGLKKNKHFALLAHADDNVGFLRNTVGFAFSKLWKSDFTPSQVPVELVLNGDYIGLYFLTETIRIDKNRLNIEEPKDESDDPNGSWLIELDNYRVEIQQIHIPFEDTNLHAFNITYHSPEVLSEKQEKWLLQQMMNLKTTLFSEDKNSADLEKILDIESLAKYYIIAEITDHLEAFLGSCYLYKEKDKRWKFGPVWDFGQAFNTYHEKNMFIYEGNTQFPHSIIEQIVQFPCFQDMVRIQWRKFYTEIYPHIFEIIDKFVDQISTAAKVDYERWPDYGNEDMNEKRDMIKQLLCKKCDFLNKVWIVPTLITDSGCDEPKISIVDLKGFASNNHSKGLSIIRKVYPNGQVEAVKIVR